MKRLILLSISAMLLSTGCDVSKTRLFKSYITEYSYNKNIELKITNKGNIAIYRKYTSEDDHIKTASYSFKSKGEEKRDMTNSVKFTTTLATIKKEVILSFLFGEYAPLSILRR